MDDLGYDGGRGMIQQLIKRSFRGVYCFQHIHPVIPSTFKVFAV